MPTGKGTQEPHVCSSDVSAFLVGIGKKFSSLENYVLSIAYRFALSDFDSMGGLYIIQLCTLEITDNIANTSCL